MKLAIIGSRSFNNEKLLKDTISEYFTEFSENNQYVGYLPRFKEIVSGGAVGADKMSESIAKFYGVKMKIFKPEYDKYPGNVAPLKRNEQIIEYADVVLAFWDSESRGTQNAIGHAKRLKKPTLIIYF